MKTALYSVAEIRKIEQAAMADAKKESLMQQAGQAAATLALALIPTVPDFAKILILAGPGNNGGDALEAAYRLALSGAHVNVLLQTSPDVQFGDRAQALQRAKNSAVQFVDLSCMSEAIAFIASTRWTLIIDGLFGIGLKRAISGDLRNIVIAINTLNYRPNCPILALDVPSGLDADTGDIVGNGSGEGCAVRASDTITFIGDKPGLHTCYGRDYAGKVQVASLQIDSKHFTEPSAFLNDIELFSHFLHPRFHNSHKGSYGDLAVVGGAHGMAGAPILSARAALHCGAGRVFIAFCDDAPAYDSVQPELMCRHASQFDFGSATLIAGPGLGNSRNAVDVLTQVLNADTSLVLDADALNLIAVEPGLRQKAMRRRGDTLMTPHPLEAARLLGISGAEVQANRLDAARQLARQFQATVVLKGSGTVVAGAHGMIIINTTGNPALATAGTGDVLAGICGALLAQDWPAWEAALAAVWIHGQAADNLVKQDIGPIGLTASELIPAIRSTLNQLIAKHTLNEH